MNRRPQDSESSLLLQLPKSVLSYGDLSGSSFLMPVAVENVAASDKNTQEVSGPENNERPAQLTEPSSVCQLQQPLLMRRGSSPGPKMAVPYSESNSNTTNNEPVQTGMSFSGPPLQFSASNNGITSQFSENQTRSNSTGPSVQSSAFLSGFQNQPSTMHSEFTNQSGSSLSQSFNQDNANLGYENVYSPPESSAPSGSSYPNNVPVMTQMFPDFSGKSCEYQGATSVTDYYSQPPVITPSNTPAYYNSSGKSISQVSQSYPNMSNENYNIHNSNVMNTELYSHIYEVVKPYWLFKDIVETKEMWYGFSNTDSERLEAAFQQDPQAVVPVDGGRYDAMLSERIKKPVYFEAKNLHIRRCTWFFRPDTSQRFIPFPEDASSMLEQHYSNCVTSGQWQQRINVPHVGSVVFEAPQVLLYYKSEVDMWPTLPDSKANPKPVRRGLPENFDIMPSENNHIDHLVFIVQGIGSFCDLRFRTVSECVDGFRDIANKLLGSHFRREIDSGLVGRVEFLPLAWHAKLHTNDKGFDRCMQNITLPSIPKLRHFTNDTLLDILLYSSPFYCQTIIDTVSSELNKLYELFLKRTPGFTGKVFVAGHSLGSLILFDILSHQKMDDISNITGSETNVDPSSESVVESNNEKVVAVENIADTYDSITSLLQACQLEDYIELFEKEKIDLSSVTYLSNEDLKDLGLPTGPRKKLLNAVHSNSKIKNMPESEDDASESSLSVYSQDKNIYEQIQATPVVDSERLIFPFKTSPCMSAIKYPRLHFEPAAFFALGSPISMFLTVRGYDSISEDFRFPTCATFFHIFHPYDPVAFRIEPLIDPNFSAKPVLIPHHKGRKRMHLEIRENLSKVGLEIKQKVLETLRYTWNSLSGFARAHTFPSSALEAEVDKLVSQQMSESEYEQQAPSETSGEEIQIGSLNGGRRIDYVLQEKPIEALNDYIFALTSHATYWDSEDTVLMFLREIYATQGILVSSQSILENRLIPHTEHSSYEPYAQLDSSMPNPNFYENPGVGQVHSNVSPFCNQNVQQLTQISSQSIQSLSNYVTGAPQMTNNVPPPTTTAQQPVGPPPLTGFVKKSPFAR